jgi:hypothetical protein
MVGAVVVMMVVLLFGLAVEWLADRYLSDWEARRKERRRLPRNEDDPEWMDWAR